MAHFHLLTAISTVLIGTTLSSAALAVDKIRHCQGEYRWETTGGTHSGEFGYVSAFGKKSTASNARKAARGALMDCFQAQWDTRWDRKVPARCKIGAKVDAYDLDTTCVQRKTGVDSDKVCDASGHTTNQRTVVAVPNGDIKTALEVQVCCLYEDGETNFLNNNSVFVRLTGNTWSNNTSHGYQQECNGNRQLTDTYEINCTKVRSQICKHR